MTARDEDTQLRLTALQNVQTILQARQRAEQELIKTKEALEEERRILELLNETAAKLAAKLDLQSVMQTAIDAATQLSGAQFGVFHASTVADRDGIPLCVVAGIDRHLLGSRATPSLAPTLRGERAIRSDDLRADSRYRHLAPQYGMPPEYPPVRSYLAVPVIARSGNAIGDLFFGHAERGLFTERSERLILAVAGQAAMAIDNARLYEDARRSADERARMLDVERATRAEIERVSLLKDEFLATLSHELRTPLNAILGWSGVLLSRSAEGSEARRGLETITRNARAQAQLIEDLLDMNRIISGKIRLDVQRLDLTPIVEAALDSARPSAEAKSIAIRQTLDPNAGPVFGDPNRLQQIVWNLLTNAVKFTPKGGRIDVLVQRVNSHVEISIHDSGIGIGPEFLPHVFERFRQADSSAARKYGGLGLGLSIVKQLVELHGGSVKAESAGSGTGATFVVSLPLRAVHDLGAPREHPTTERPHLVPAPALSLAGITVLVVDDETDARVLVKCVLTEAGADVLTAGSAAEGLAFVVARHPDVIVSDIGMPERDGYDFMRDVRGLAAASGGRTPAIALTAFARSMDRTRAMLAGYQVHMSKPIEPQELVATIGSLATTVGNRAG